MDINQLATVEQHEAGTEFQLVNTETGEKEEVIFVVKGLDSKAWRDAQKELRRKSMGQDEDFDLFEFENLAPAVAKVITDWRNLNKGNKPFPYSEENELWLCENSPNVVNQIFTFLLNRENFIKG